MIILNFSHPLTDDQRAQVEALTGQRVARVIDISTQFDHARPFIDQVIELLDSVDLTPTEWQQEVLLINPPALNFIVAALLAELHGRMGHFPPILRLRPASGFILPRYEVAEIINLQGARDAARNRRQG